MTTAPIIVNISKDPDCLYAKELCLFLESKGIKSWITTEITKDIYIADGNDSKSAFLIILGGDGTMLKAAPRAAMLNIPLFGINLGNVGFLTTVPKNRGLHALEKICLGEYSIEERMMLEVDFGTDKPIPLHRKLALNECFIGGSGKLTELSLYINNEHIDVIRADGLIISTPTGSTAYNQSAGGPVLMPLSEMLVITPVCPHHPASRPLVIGPNDNIRIIARGETSFIIDGRTKRKLPSEGSILICASEIKTKIIKTASTIYGTLKRKKW